MRRIPRFALCSCALALLVAAFASAVVTTRAPASAQAAGGYQALTPARILDTRNGVGAAAGPVGAGGSISVKVAGVGGVPASGVGAVVLNVTATNPSAATFVTVWPTGQPKPDASNLNVVAGESVPNLVVATVGNGGSVSLFNYAGTVDLLADVTGWFPAGGSYDGLTPTRILDTRNGVGAAAGPVGAGGSISVKVTGVGGVPASGVGAVVLNVTATNPSAATFVTVWPTGQPKPDASNLNVVAGESVPNLVVATVGNGGNVSLFNYAGTVDLLADVAGWFPLGAAPAGSYNGLTPSRIYDSRAAGATLAAGGTADVKVTGIGGVPASGVAAVVLNVTATNPTAATFVSVYPKGQPQPNVSNLNVVAGQSVPNAVIATVGADGSVTLFNYAGSIDVIVDVAGWFPGSEWPAPGLAGRLLYGEGLYVSGLASFSFSSYAETTVYDHINSDGFALDPGGDEFTSVEPAGPGSLDRTVSIHDVGTGAFKESFTLAFLDHGDSDPVFPSPNGQLFAAIVQGEDSFGPTSLVVVNRQGVTVKLFPSIRSAAWMPDGRLVFTGQDPGGTGVLGVFPDVATSNAVNVIASFAGPFEDLPYSLAVSPNGSEIAYTYNSNLWVQPFGGGAARLVAQSTVGGPLTGAAFSPDGAYLAFKMGWPSGLIHVLPNHHGAPVLVDPDDGTRLYDAQGRTLEAWHQLYWLA